MAIGSEQKLLRYRLIERIGQGDMGEVWRARDTKLDRDVAVSQPGPAIACRRSFSYPLHRVGRVEGPYFHLRFLARERSSTPKLSHVGRQHCPSKPAHIWGRMRFYRCSEQAGWGRSGVRGIPSWTVT